MYLKYYLKYTYLGGIALEVIAILCNYTRVRSEVHGLSVCHVTFVHLTVLKPFDGFLCHLAGAKMSAHTNFLLSMTTYCWPEQHLVVNRNSDEDSGSCQNFNKLVNNGFNVINY